VFRAQERTHMTNPITQWNRMASANSVERLVAERAEKADKAADASASAAAARPANPAADDELHLSEVARQASMEPAFDRAKVEAIKKQVEQGLYPLDARRMAESFIALEQMIRE
jgi:negative regulator of flagellin synthesis FlgM